MFLSKFSNLLNFLSVIHILDLIYSFIILKLLFFFYVWLIILLNNFLYFFILSQFFIFWKNAFNIKLIFKFTFIILSCLKVWIFWKLWNFYFSFLKLLFIFNLDFLIALNVFRSIYWRLNIWLISEICIYILIWRR